MYTKANLEDKYLNDLIEKKVFVAVYLKNGIKLTGILVGAAKHSLYLKHGITQYISKTAVSTVVAAVYSDNL